MKILPVTNTKLNNVPSSKNTKCIVNPIITKSPSFKAIDPSTILIVTRLRQMVDKKQNRDRLLALVTEVLYEPQKHKETLSFALQSLAALHMVKSEESLKNLKMLALTNAFNILDDNIGDNRTAKKNFMRDLAQQGKHMDKNFINAFKNLDDGEYKDFKTCFIDDLLYSNAHNEKRQDPNFLLFNIKLIRTLPYDIYFDFLTKNKNGIINLNNCLLKSTIGIFNSKKNLAYVYYANNFSYEYKDYDKDWGSYVEGMFNIIVNANKNNTDELAKALNVNKELANEILLDDEALTKAKDATNVKEKLEILSLRLDNKFKSIEELTYKKFCKFLGNNIFKSDNAINRNKAESLRFVYADIEGFINKTEIAPILKTKYEENLKKIAEEIARKDELSILEIDDYRGTTYV